MDEELTPVKTAPTPSPQELAKALRRSKGVQGATPIPTPDEDPMLHSLNSKNDRRLEKWLRQKNGQELRTEKM